MTAASAYARLETLLAQAMTAPDPAEALRRAADDPDLSPELRRAFAAIDPDGARMAALLVARLRFERLLRASPEAEAWFERDPAAFSSSFRRYHEAVPNAAFFPPEEARLFRAWLRRAARDDAPG